MDIKILRKTDYKEAIKIKEKYMNSNQELSKNMFDKEKELKFLNDWMNEKCDDVRIMLGAYEEESLCGFIGGSYAEDYDSSNGFEINYLFIDEKKKSEYLEMVRGVNCEVIYTTTIVLNYISSGKSPQGIIGIIDTGKLAPIVISNDFLILDNIQDPGNLGAIIRSAAASGFKNIYMMSCVDIYNDKVIRASMGNIFKTINHSVTFEKLTELLSKGEFEIIAGDLDGENLFTFDLPKDKTVGIIIGNEGKGISSQVKRLTTKTVTIPMQNKVESLNAAVSASMIMYYIKN